MKNTLTKKVALTVALNALELVNEKQIPVGDWTLDDIKGKLNEIVASLDKKTDNPENEAIKRQILELLANGENMKSSEVAKELNLSSGQKAASLLNTLVKESKVIKTKGTKGVSLFSLREN